LLQATEEVLSDLIAAATIFGCSKQRLFLDTSTTDVSQPSFDCHKQMIARATIMM
jgi:hypothetical protein